ncbi:TniB family NTP-binding protein [Jannaschia formosa]|uniref:TniB family NTP-binding protein n=1 Tax=Jannaschia formosa TaxID=2259592 RepID=UPI000E1C0A62|nr:TniB family NTP-binding protein [Jannaschia formosa]TFL19782.1 transposase [Jannaschia formosa]
MASFAEVNRKLSRLRKRHVQAPWEQQFSYHLDRLLEHDGEGNALPRPILDATGETRGILAVAGPGGGKTWTVHRTLSRHPALRMQGDGSRPYIASTVPSGATYKSMAQQLLVDSGYEMETTRRAGWESWEAFRHRVRTLGTAVLWIDEAHDLFRRENENILPALKSLMQGDGAVVLILTGTEALDQVIRSDPQVKRRLSTVRIPDVSVEHDRENFESLIEEYCDLVELEAAIESDLVDRLAHGARHQFGRVITTIVEAIEQALVSGDAVLTTQHFAEAYDLKEGCEPDRNVSLLPDWHRIDPDSDPFAPILPMPRRRRR